MATTVIQHVLKRLREVGISDIFGVPGDYAFAVNDAICSDPELRWIGSCNELNAAYAADGYARVRGFAALCTTFGVGELSALNGLAGSYIVTASASSTLRVMFMLMNLKGTSTSSVTSSQNPSTLGQAVTFTASVTSPARAPCAPSVAPGIRQVTVTLVSLSSARSAKENESRNALVPL